jgi:succinate dehydrogenase/fumarate reductase cytochrome b subunit
VEEGLIEEVSFTKALLVTFAIGFTIFGVAGGLLVAFWRTFGDEEQGPYRRRRLTRFTLLVVALVILAGFGFWTTYQ